DGRGRGPDDRSRRRRRRVAAPALSGESRARGLPRARGGDARGSGGDDRHRGRRRDPARRARRLGRRSRLPSPASRRGDGRAGRALHRVEQARRRGPRDRGRRAAQAVRARAADGDRAAARSAGRFTDVTITGVVRSPAEFESRLQRFLFERAEEARAVRVGEKEVSEQAEIVGRYRDLFSRGQLAALAGAEEAANDDDERELLYRLRKTCEGGIVAAELVEQEDALENAELAARVSFRDEELPLRAAQARLAVLPEYGDRDLLGDLQADVSASLNPMRLDLLRAGEELSAELSGEPDPVARNEEEKNISLRQLATVLADASAVADEAFRRMRERWCDRLLGPERDDRPKSFHMSWVRRLSPLESTYSKERATEVCLDTLKSIGFDLGADPNIRTDLDDRPQKSPRACVIASDPPQIVHLITRAQGGLHDYQAFMHE